MVLVTALIGNNVQRQYPKFWVSQIPPPPAPEVKDLQQKKMEEKEGSSEGGSTHDTLSDLERGPL